MTKIKNTKKGMAKKTLSISLAVAMLATSNVPVWAAEFTDGTDAAFTSEAVVETPVEEVVTDAPVVEEEKAEDASVITNEGDITLDLSVDKTSAVWDENGKITVSGTVTKKGEALTSWDYRWLDESGISRQNQENVTSVDAMSLTTKSALAGKKLTLYVYDYDVTGQKLFDINTGITVTVEKRAITDATMTKVDKTYNGFAQTVDNPSVIVTDQFGSSVDADAYTATATSATNFGEKITVTVTAKDDSAYVGSASVLASEIVKKTYADGDIVAHTADGQTYQYTGKAIKLDNDKVTLTESKSANNGTDGKLNGADLSKALVKAEVESQVGENNNVCVYFDASKLDNIDASKATNKYVIAQEKVTIKKRDLSTDGTKITVNTLSGEIPTKIAVKDLYNYLTFTGVEGTSLNLKNDKDYTVIVKNPDGTDATAFVNGNTYDVTVRAKDGGNCEKEQSFKLTATAAALQGVTAEKTYETEYTGSEIKPSKSDLGSLKISYYNESGKLVSESLGSDAYEIVDYTNNTNATTEYDTDGKTPIATAYAKIKILSGTYKDQTANIPFLIKPLEVVPNYVSVPADISYNKGYTKPEEYKVPVTVTAKNKAGKNAITLTDADFTVKYDWENDATKNTIGNSILTTVTVTNPNYIANTTNGKTVTVEVKNADPKVTNQKTKIVARKITDSMVVVTPDTYTYTGGKIEPTYAVVDGVLVLYKKGQVADDLWEYEEVGITDAVNVGTGKITVKGDGKRYSGTATGTFKITAANTADVKVSIDDQDYTGRQVRPREFKATLNGNDVTSQFEIVSYGENKEAGKGTVVLKPVDGNKNFTGDNITAEFNIVKERIKANLKAYDSNGIEYTYTTDNSEIKATFDFDGNEKKFAKVVVDSLKKLDGKATTATVDDIEIKYVDNIAGIPEKGKDNYAWVYAVAKEGSAFSGNETITTADGTVIKGVVAKKKFRIKSVKFVDQNVSLKNATYAAGLPVKPEILIQIGGSTLVEGKDYTVKLTEKGKEVTPTEVTVGNIYGVEITGINGYTGSKVVSQATFNKLFWGVDKKNLSDCNVTVKDGVVTVLNGYLPVASTEYTVKNNNNGTYTITAEELSKHYTGSVTVDAEGKAEDEKPDAPMIQSVKVVGNKATVILSGETEGAVGYDYVISTDKDCINNKDYDKVNKNILNTTTDFTYVGQDVYYAYCHAWKRGEDGKKIFSDWSNAYPFVVSAITPSQPAITSVKVKGSTVTVTYTKSSNADGYDVVLGSKVATVAGEKRPVEYANLVKKNIKGNTVTATFKNVKKGTYYAGLHAFNRTSEDGKKVFSPWSNVKRVTVK